MILKIVVVGKFKSEAEPTRARVLLGCKHVEAIHPSLA